MTTPGCRGLADGPVGLPEGARRLVAVVRPAAQLDILDRGLSPRGVGLDVVELEEASLRAAPPVRGDEATLPALPLPDRRRTAAGIYRELDGWLPGTGSAAPSDIAVWTRSSLSTAVRRPLTAAYFCFARSLRSVRMASLTTVPRSPSGIRCRRRSCAIFRSRRVSSSTVNCTRYWPGASGSTTGRLAGGIGISRVSDSIDGTPSGAALLPTSPVPARNGSLPPLAPTHGETTSTPSGSCPESPEAVACSRSGGSRRMLGGTGGLGCSRATISSTWRVLRCRASSSKAA